MATKIQLYIYDNKGYQCNNLLGYVQSDEERGDYSVADYKGNFKGRVSAKVSLVREHIQNLMKDRKGGHRETVDELVSELKSIFPEHTRLFIMIEEMREVDRNGN